ncbi:four helix bundle protein [Aquimarina gracilis]|uniref:Four helix bundle protein n=1 Tax=Aquimarina gracilis TaxID=874422 RepID=A0ABU6A1P3_9FLAO|nr:four helix bundle protein [Aquimarina gracilis]MEB3348084.1 four helix bundle protein [Aquimarina gracilis]
MIEERSFQFALRTITLVKALRKANEYVFADQILRSATSIGSNVAEAGAGQSKKDFIAKMAIASKEARETRYWLRLLKESDLIVFHLSDLLDEVNKIIKILTKIVKTSQLKT